MRSQINYIFTVLTLIVCAGTSWAGKSQFQDNNFKRSDKAIYTLWHRIPFFAAGDIGQYQQTMSQSRDSVRKTFWNDLTTALESMADKGAMVEAMLEPMANILMMFDQLHDIHKAQDVIRIDQSIEAQFKASLDQLYTAYDIRDDKRKLQVSSGTQLQLMDSYIQGLASSRNMGRKLTAPELNSKLMMEMYNQIDYIAYGTFSSLGGGQFQITLHMQGHKNGVVRSFASQGRLVDAVNGVALQVFNFFQKNNYADWENPQQQLTWMPMPINPNKAGYSFEEAKMYCQSRGYRLPYSRELMQAESGGAYKPGGIDALRPKIPYAVADKRSTNEGHSYTPGNESATGGAVQGASYTMSSGSFWCVKGKVSDEILMIEEIWALIRKYRSDREIYQALETIRYELGDFGIKGQIYWGPRVEVLERLDSLQTAVSFLKSQNINVPKGLN